MMHNGRPVYWELSITFQMIFTPEVHAAPYVFVRGSNVPVGPAVRDARDHDDGTSKSLLRLTLVPPWSSGGGGASRA